MRWPHSDKEISPQNAVGVGMSTTLHMPIAPAACSPWTQAFMVEALPQKKQSWWISTTAYGDFQPKKILIQTAADHSQCMGQIGAVSLHRD
jgi:hypothetical protein